MCCVDFSFGGLEFQRIAPREHQLAAGHYVDNPASARVLRKIGFRETGEVRPAFCRARGGELVLARRYALELEPAEGEVDAARMRAA